MRSRIHNQFIANYIVIFIISVLLAIAALILTDFANDLIAKTLVKNQYTAQSVMRGDIADIDAAPVVANGGGVQAVNRDFEVVFSAGLNTLPDTKLSAAAFTEFLVASRQTGTPYSYDVAYNEQQEYWLIVTFPTSLRIDFAIARNKQYRSVDLQVVAGVFVAIVMLYFLLLAAITYIYSKLTAFTIVRPLQKLSQSAKLLRDGNYAARVDLNLKNEFAELQNTFNTMARKIEYEMDLRKRSEENRKKLILDISHDLKNPLAAIMGYAQLCRDNPDLPPSERERCLQVIHENSARANHLITDLFELSKLESSEYTLDTEPADFCEYIRETLSTAIPVFDQAGFTYEFDIPEHDIAVRLDRAQMDRVLQNLVANTVQYNHSGTHVTVAVVAQQDQVCLIFKDDGVGIPAGLAHDIFKPFYRADPARNSQTGGTGLGLAIVHKVIAAHGGAVTLKTDAGSGCEFMIRLPRH